MSGDLETFERKIGGGLHGACQLTASGRGKKQSDSQLWLEVGSGGKKKSRFQGSDSNHSADILQAFLCVTGTLLSAKSIQAFPGGGSSST